MCTLTPGCAAPRDSPAGAWEPPALRAGLHWAVHGGRGRLPGPCCVGTTGLALQSRQSSVLALLEPVAEAHLARGCPAQGRTASHRRAADIPPGPLPTARQAVSSPPSKSVTHGASHIPQLQEIQKSLSPSLPPAAHASSPPSPAILLLFKSFSLAAIFSAPGGKKYTLTSFLSALRNPHGV